MSSFEVDARARASVAERIARASESKAETAVRHEWQGQGNARPVTFHTAPDARTSARLINFALVTIGAAVMAGTVASLAYSAIVETFARVAAALAL